MDLTELSSSTGHLPFELIALTKAVRYQQWIIKAIQPYLGNSILELGAGIGNMSRWFTQAERLILTEYDIDLLTILKERAATWPSHASDVSILPLNLANESLAAFQPDAVDTIVSFNVLEHIEDDAKVMRNCADLLRSSQAVGKKRIVTFVPAHQFAYGVMDKAVGHHRRYNQAMIKKLHKECTPDAKLILKPFNFVGLWGWLVNGRILRRECAGADVIGIFERLCPYFQLIDNVVISTLGIPLGQSLIVIQEW
jgi:SAM-dependent methyltransferase